MTELEPTVALTTAATDAQLEGILALQRQYHLRAVTPEIQAAEGFVFAEHTLPLLRRMASRSPQAIALAGEQVVGYCLSLVASLQEDVPALVPMFEQFARCVYRGRPLPAHRFLVGGQVCVDRAYRRQGLLAGLYQQIRAAVKGRYELCVTEIATRNLVSMRAHEKLGFRLVSTYHDAGEEWAIVAWELG